MSDLDKVKHLFDEIGVEYTISNNQISIGNNSIIEYEPAYGKALGISFSKEGKFLGFEPWANSFEFLDLR